MGDNECCSVIVLINISKFAKRMCQNFENTVDLSLSIIFQRPAFMDMHTTVAKLASVGIERWASLAISRVVLECSYGQNTFKEKNPKKTSVKRRKAQISYHSGNMIVTRGEGRGSKRKKATMWKFLGWMPEITALAQPIRSHSWPLWKTLLSFYRIDNTFCIMVAELTLKDF